MQITFELQGEETLIAKMDLISQNLDLSSGLDKIGQFLKDYYATEPFLSSGSVYGSTWAPLKMSTERDKFRQGYSGTPMLIRTGAMATSFDYYVDGNRVTIFNGQPYFKYHQSTLPRNKIPRRQMMAINEAIKGKVHDFLQQELVKKLQ